MVSSWTEGESPPEGPSREPARQETDGPASPIPSRSAPMGPRDVVPSTPGARRLAAKLDVDISEVTPSGPRGRGEDVLTESAGGGRKQIGLALGWVEDADEEWPGFLPQYYK